MANQPYLPTVSVIIPIYNGEGDLPELIRCLRSQTYPRDRIEYLLVDNKSSDRTPTILAEAFIQAKNEGLDLKVLNETQIQSSYAARNQAIHRAVGEIILFTDSDCRPLADWAEQMVVPFADSNIGIVVGELKALTGPSLLEKYAERVQMMSQHFLVEHSFCPYGQTANLAIRRIAFTEVGLFRPYLTTGGDADICWRIQQQTPWQLTTAPKAIIHHRHRNNLGDLCRQWYRYGCSNRYLHELHGVELMEDLTIREAIYRISRWLLKELPQACLNIIQGKAPAIDLIITPLELIIYQSRTSGQKQDNFSENFRKIDYLESSKSHDLITSTSLSS